MKLLRERNPDLKFKAFIVGDGELLEPIMSMITQSGLDFCRYGDTNYKATIIFTSWRKDIDVINAGSDIIALTSLNEGTPVSIIEAMASQRAVICTDVGGVKDVVTDGYSGLLSAQEPNEFSDKLKKLVANKEFRIKLALNSQRFVLENYTHSRLTNEIECLYDFLLKRNIN